MASHEADQVPFAGQIREISDQVWGQLVALVARLRDDAAPYPAGVDPIIADPEKSGPDSGAGRPRRV